MPDEEKLSRQASQNKSDASYSSSDTGSTSSTNWLELLTIAFWRRNFRYLIVFAPKCVLPSCLVCMAMIIIVIGNVGFYAQIGRGPVNLNELLTTAAICLFANLIALILFVLGFGRWLFV